MYEERLMNKMDNWNCIVSIILSLICTVLGFISWQILITYEYHSRQKCKQFFFCQTYLTKKIEIEIAVSRIKSVSNISFLASTQNDFKLEVASIKPLFGFAKISFLSKFWYKSMKRVVEKLIKVMNYKNERILGFRPRC